MHEVELPGTEGPIRPQIVTILEDDRFACSRQFEHVNLTGHWLMCHDASQII
jgi:hypothetical protein